MWFWEGFVRRIEMLVTLRCQQLSCVQAILRWCSVKRKAFVKSVPGSQLFGTSQRPAKWQTAIILGTSFSAGFSTGNILDLNCQHFLVTYCFHATLKQCRSSVLLGSILSSSFSPISVAFPFHNYSFPQLFRRQSSWHKTRVNGL